jgi:hypothetical protein
MEAAIEGHGSSHRGLTRRWLVTLLVQQAIDAKATGSRILALQVQDLFDKGQTHLIIRVMRGQDKDARIAELERLVGRLTMQAELSKKAQSYASSLLKNREQS